MGIAIQDGSAEGKQSTGRGTAIWFVVSVLFTVGNVAGGAIAFRDGEFAHAGVHALLVFAGAKIAWQLAQKRFAHATALDAGEALQDSFGELRERLRRIEQSVEAVAIEVERVGEGQRFMARLYSSKDATTVDKDASPERPEMIQTKKRE